MKKIALLAVMLVAAISLSSCSHPMAEAKERALVKVARTYNTDANEAYYAVRWALKTSGYSITSENLQDGVVMSSWLASKVDSFYVDPWGGHPDFGADGAYYRLEVRIVPTDDSSKTRVEVISHVKSLIAHLHSSEIYEKKILSKVSDYLRNPDLKVTNLGAEE